MKISYYLSVISHLNPFKNDPNRSVAEYTIKKLLAFVLIYCFSAVLGEGIIIGVLYRMGYDPLHGVMPAGQIGELLPYYGFLVFLFVTIAYCRLVEKKTMQSIGFSGNAADYLAGVLLAAILLAIIIGINCISGSMIFLEWKAKVDFESLFLWILAFGIQGAAEEMMCRGFLLHSLLEKISIPKAVMISSSAFVLPHLMSLLEADFAYAIVGIMNLYLISIVFSMLVLRRSGLWIACGLHSAWNFILYVIMSLSLSGVESTSKGIILFGVKDAGLLNGAAYGIEAGLITTAVLGILATLILKGWQCEKNF